MAIETITRIKDDLDGTEDATTITFAFQGTNYEIDLAEKNAARFEKALTPFIEASRRVRSTPGRGYGAPARARAQTRASELGYSTEAIREWARSQGKEVSDRGRIANDIVEEYHEAQTKVTGRRAARKTATPKS